MVRTIPQPGAEYGLLVRDIHLGDAEDKLVLAAKDYKSIMFHHCYQIAGSVNFDGLNPIRPINDVYRFACKVHSSLNLSVTAPSAWMT